MIPYQFLVQISSQYVITINILWTSRINNKLSSHEQVFGNFNYDHTTMAPPGIKVLLREHPKDRSSWYPHALSTWYIVPSIEHYCCHQIWILVTNLV